MRALSILQQTTPPLLPKVPPRGPRPLHQPTRTWQLHSGAKGFSTTRPKPKDREAPPIPKKPTTRDDKIPDVVWERMIKRIMFYVGVPLGIGFALLYGLSVLQEQGLWDVPKWVPYLTTFITFGTSSIGIAYGSLSTSLDADEKGSFLGFEQVAKNWNEMWQEDEEEES